MGRQGDLSHMLTRFIGTTGLAQRDKTGGRVEVVMGSSEVTRQTPQLLILPPCPCPPLGLCPPCPGIFCNRESLRLGRRGQGANTYLRPGGGGAAPADPWVSPSVAGRTVWLSGPLVSYSVQLPVFPLASPRLFLWLISSCSVAPSIGL